MFARCCVFMGGPENSSNAKASDATNHDVSAPDWAQVDYSRKRKTIIIQSRIHSLEGFLGSSGHDLGTPGGARQTRNGSWADPSTLEMENART